MEKFVIVRDENICYKTCDVDRKIDDHIIDISNVSACCATDSHFYVAAGFKVYQFSFLNGRITAVYGVSGAVQKMSVYKNFLFVLNAENRFDVYDLR